MRELKGKKKKVDDSLARSTTLDGSSCRSSGLCSPPSSGDGGDEMNRLCVAHHQTNTVSLRKKLKEEE